MYGKKSTSNVLVAILGMGMLLGTMAIIGSKIFTDEFSTEGRSKAANFGSCILIGSNSQVPGCKYYCNNHQNSKADCEARMPTNKGGTVQCCTWVTCLADGLCKSAAQQCCSGQSHRDTNCSTYVRCGTGTVGATHPTGSSGSSGSSGGSNTWVPTPTPDPNDYTCVVNNAACLEYGYGATTTGIPLTKCSNCSSPSLCCRHRKANATEVTHYACAQNATACLEYAKGGEETDKTKCGGCPTSTKPTCCKYVTYQ